MANQQENILIDFSSPISNVSDLQCPLVPAPGRNIGSTFFNPQTSDAGNNPFDFVIQQLHNNNKADDPFEFMFEQACKSDENAEVVTTHDSGKADPCNSAHNDLPSGLLTDNLEKNEVIHKNLTYHEKFEAYKSKLYYVNGVKSKINSVDSVPNTVDCILKKDFTKVIVNSQPLAFDNCVERNAIDLPFKTSSEVNEKFISDKNSECIIENITDSVIIDSMDMLDVSPIRVGKLISPVRCDSVKEQRIVGELIELELNRTIELMSQLSTSTAVDNGLSCQSKEDEFKLNIMNGDNLFDVVEDVGKWKQNGNYMENGSLDTKSKSDKSINRSCLVKNKSAEGAGTESNIKAIVADRVQKCIQKALNDSRTISRSSQGISENDYSSSNTIKRSHGDLALNTRNHHRSFSSSVLDKGYQEISQLKNTTLLNANPLYSGLNLEDFNSSFYKRRLDFISQNSDSDGFLNKRFRIGSEDVSSSKRKSSFCSIVDNVSDEFKHRSLSTSSNVLSSELNIGFIKHSTSTINSNSSFHLNGFQNQHDHYNITNTSNSVLNDEDSLAMIDGDDSVFMEAKSLACIFKHKADSYSCLPTSDLSDDGDFLTSKQKSWETLQLASTSDLEDLEVGEAAKPVDTHWRDESVRHRMGRQLERRSFDESLSKNGTDCHMKQKPGCRSFDGSLSNVETESKKHRRSASIGSSTLLSSLPALSQDGIRTLSLQTHKNIVSPVLVPPPPVPRLEKGDSRLKPIKSQVNSQPGKKGPMKAMMPLGSMMRNPIVKAIPVHSSSSTGSSLLELPKLAALNPKNITKMRPVAQSTPSRNRDANMSLHDNKMFSPILQRHVATDQKPPSFRRSTSAASGIPSLTSPPISLRSLKEASTGHERSKSVDQLPAANTSIPAASSAAIPTAKTQRHIKSTSNIQNYKKSAVKVSPAQELQKKSTAKISPAQELQKKSLKSIPLKALTQNSPIASRRSRLSIVKPLIDKLKRSNAIAAEKENVIPQ